MREKKALNRRLHRIRARLIQLQGPAAIVAIERQFIENGRQILYTSCSTVDRQTHAQTRYRNQIKYLEKQTGIRQ